MGGVPCLPAFDPSTITSPAEGMLIFNSVTSKPEIYTGTAWEDWCSSNITASTVDDYFIVKGNIPYLPAKTIPTGTVDPGAIVYSTTDHALVIYSGSKWVKISDMKNNSFTASPGFASLGGTIRTCKIPILDSDPTVAGLTAGAFYINTSTKTFRYYNGATWKDVGCVPVIETLPATSIQDATAVSGGNIISNNGPAIIMRGICWSVNPNPDISLTTKIQELVSGDGLGTYNETMTGLKPNSLYHIRAFAYNGVDIAYGDDKTFTTQIAMPTIITTDASNIQNTTAVTGGEIKDDGGSAITARGVYWSTASDPLDGSTQAMRSGVNVTHDGSGTGPFPTTLTKLLEKTTYYIRAYAVNARGMAYGNLVQFTTPPAIVPVLGPTTINNISTTTATGNITILNNGGALVQERGVRWTTDRVNYQSAISTTTSDSDVGAFIANMTNLDSGTTYYVQSYATNSVGVGYSVEGSFNTASWVTLTTTPVSIINASTATSGGNITDTGGIDVTKCGVCWDVNPHPAVTLSTKTEQSAPSGNGLGQFASALTNLSSNTTYYVRAYAINAKGVSYGDEQTFITPKLAAITTTAVSNVTGYAAVSGGNITDDGGQSVTMRGVCWGTSQYPAFVYNSDPLATNLNYTLNGSGIGSFVSNISGLLSGTTYYARAFAVNSSGIAYGDQISFITASYATVTTNAITDITNVTANSGGTVSDNGKSTITSEGVCWSTTPNPTVACNKTVETVNGDGVGSFSSTMSNLLGNTTYYVRAYAINGMGVAYDTKDATFTTAPPIVPTVNTTSVTNITNVFASSGGTIVSNGGAPILESGICWSTSDPQLDINAVYAKSGAVSGSYTTNLTSLLGNTTYSVRAYAKNSKGTAFGNMLTFQTLPATAPVINPMDLTITNVDNNSASTQMTIVNDGGAPITSSGIEWGTGTLDVHPINTPAGSTIGTFNYDLSGLLIRTTYYVRGFATNNVGTTYTNWTHFTTTAHATVTTSPVTSVTGSTAISGGDVTVNPEETLTNVGVCWSTNQNPTIDDSPKTVQTTTGSGEGTFVSNVAGLSPNTTYYLRAYATNSTGTGYGDQVTFKTASLPVITTAAATNVLSSKFDIGGNNISDGGQPITEKGVCWYLYNPLYTYYDLPTIGNSRINCGTGTDNFTTTLSSLLGNGTTYYVRAYAINSVGVTYGNLVVVHTAPVTIASLTTTLVTDVSSVSATSGGTVTDTGGDPSGTKGICWSVMEPPTTNDNFTNIYTGTNPFVSIANNLMGSTTYYLRAFVINSAGIAYGNQVSFTTAPPVLATVTTSDPTNVAGVTATGGGTIVSNGGAEVTLRGVCWSTSKDPSYFDNHQDAHVGGNGTFSCDITGLTPLTTYYYRAYAFNSEGIAYGDPISFTTFTTPTIITSPATSVTNISAVSGGTITSDGGVMVTSSGICWNTTGSATTTDSHTTGGVGIGNFINEIDGLLGNTTYYVRAYATNIAGAAYGDEVTFKTAPAVIPTLKTQAATGGSNGISINGGGIIVNNGGDPITTTGLCCGTVTGFDPATQSVSRTTQTDLGSFTGILTGLTPGTTYYVRAYATNSVGTGYGAEVSCVTPQLALLTTSDATNITRNSAVDGGNITSDGGTPVTTSGVCWNTTGSPTTADSHTSSGTGIGSFTQTITGLQGSVTYHVRAYATNGVGTAYSVNEEVITTLPPVLATVKTTIPTPTSGTTATFGGTITDDGGAMVTTRGEVWSIDPAFDPTTEAVNKTAQTGYFTGAFTDNIKDLAANTTYYVYAYVQNKVGISYGDMVSFKTPSLPTLTTNTATSIKCNSTVTGGNITDNGGVDLSKRGVIWSTIKDFVPDIQTATNVTNDYVRHYVYNDGYVSSWINYPIGSYSTSLTGLIGNTTYYVRSYATNVVGTGYGNQISFTTANPQLPVISTTSVSNVTGSSVTGTGSIDDDGGATVTTRGFMWSELSNFVPDTVIVNKVSQTGYDNGKFTLNIPNLKAGTTYYVRAYGLNSVGLAYGDPISFTTLTIPTLTTTTPVAGSTGYIAASGGTITSDGGTAVLNRGVCWSTSSKPTIGLITKTTGDAGSPFVSKMNNLTPATTYYVRAYATNAQGTAYGNELSFKTPPALPTLTTNVITGTSSSTAVTGGEITNDGGASITSRGVCWSTVPNFDPSTVTDNRTKDGVGTGSYTSTITGLAVSTTYYVRAYATNTAGTAYGNQVTVSLYPTSPVLDPTRAANIVGVSADITGKVTSNGGSQITSRGVCWDTSTNPTTKLTTKTTEAVPEDSLSVCTFMHTIKGLTPNTKYFVRAYAINNIGTAYGLETTFMTGSTPTLTATTPVTNINVTTASSGGQITDDGRMPILARGICWSIYADPTIDGANCSKTVDTSTSFIGSFTAQLTGLTQSTTYYVRAYATNAVGTVYGSAVSFKTLDVNIPTVKTDDVTSITSTSATGIGEILDAGGASITQSGIYFGTTNPPTSGTANGIKNTGSFTSQLANLARATTYYVQAYATNSKGTGKGEVKSFTTSAELPQVSGVTVVDSDIAMTSAKGTATVVDNGGSTIADQGLRWNTSGVLPSPDDQVLSTATSSTAISGVLAGLVSNTKYYIWAYATNGVGTSYSSTPTIFTTKGLPTVTTTTASSISKTGAVTGGVVANGGGSAITARGVCWSTASLPTISDAHLADPSQVTGGYTSTLISLTSGTTYYVRAYASNIYGTSYGNQITFTTLATATVSTVVSSYTKDAAVIGGNALTDGNSSLVSWGVCYSSTNSNPTYAGTAVAGVTAKAMNPNTANHLGAYSFDISGLTSATTYYVKAFVCNVVGGQIQYYYGDVQTFTTSSITPALSAVTISSIGATTANASASVVSDGGSPVFDKGLRWNTTGQSPDVSDYTLSNKMDASIGGTLSSLLPSTTYYVWAYATNSNGTAYSATPATFTTTPLPVAATIATNVPSSVTGVSAVCGGNISSDGGASVTRRGVSWSTTPTPTVEGGSFIDNGTGIGNFNCTITGLTGGTVYYVRAYAQNTQGMVYGDQQSFTTLTLPSITTAAISSITSTTATGGGSITTDGGATVSQRGICWNTTGSPTTASPNKSIIDAAGGIGSYSENITGLTANTTYYVRAYATNTQGTVYGNQVTFTTLPTPPTVSNVTIPAETMTNTTAVATAAVTDTGGAPVSVRGICWNTTGNPTTTDNTIPDSGTAVGSYSATLSGLQEGPTYYVRAYATNAGGTSYSQQATTFRICLSVSVTHSVLAGAPVNKTVTYNSVNTNISGSSKCWITKNLGADLQAASASENIDDSAGWYWQFDNSQGYLYTVGVRTPVIWNTSVNENSDWLQANDPCMLQLGGGWRLPTNAEWTAADAAPQNWQSASDAFASVLKLHEAGYLTAGGALSGRGSAGYYWSSTQSTSTVGNCLSLASGSSGMTTMSKTAALPVRCIRDDTSNPSVPIMNQVVVLDGTKTSNTIDGKAYIMFDGGSSITGRGFCWNTTGNPSITDSKVADVANGTGTFTDTMSGLTTNTTYYVRAYATNTAGVGYGVQTVFRLCPDMTVIHTAGINGAPVTKTVTYKEVSSTMSGAAHCWIAQNLGSDQQASTVSDATEASAGWYYQFNRSQGYKHDGTNYTPWNTWTSWTNCIVESSDWLPANDPCATELGTGWRLPTNTEWSNINGSPRNWSSATTAYSSELKLHEAGYLNYNNGTLNSRGAAGAYWSSTQDVVQTYNPYYYGTYYSYYMSGYVLSMTGSSSAINYMDKASALPVRCLTDESQIVLLKASISDASIPTSAITGNSATATATVSLDGGSTVTDRGICWNTTGVAPQTSDNVIPGGKGTGTFTGTLSGLTEGPTYYVRAYATNNRGTVYSTNVTSFKICPTFTIQHKAGVDGSPVDKTVTYSTISTTYSGKAACWITQNLGSDQQATAVNDATEASAGWYWQFNRSQGYKHDGTTLTPAIPAWSAWVGGISENSDWLAANDPCALELGTGWRLPTNAEWTAADAIPQNWLTAADAYGSVLKLHEAGYLDSGSGALTSRGATGNYWSSSQYNTSYGYLMSIASGSSSQSYAVKAYAYPVRCLRDQIVASMAGVSDAVIPSATMTSTSAVANVTVTPDGGSTVSARGICWNTTGSPSTSDHVITDSNTGTGDFSLTMSGLVEGPTYYVRAYATNGVGTSYSKNVTSFKICPTFTVNHTVISGAPVDKTETYSSVSTNITGSTKCWITKNLGADLQSKSAAENIDDSAGWYWQFDSPQGYQNSVGVRTPVIWNTSVNENNDWLAANDPCMLQLGGGWRLPTYAEWIAVDAIPQYWQNAADAFASVLKLHEAGYLTTGGVLSSRGTAGYYWSSTQSTSTVGNCLSLASGSSGMTTMSKTAALPVRCIRDDTSNPSVPVMNQVVVLDETKTSSTIDGKAYIMFDGGSSITGRGFCWNTSGNPSITDSKVADGANGTGTFTDTMSGLTTNTTYYVRAYATNTAGVGYGVQTVFRLCPDMTVIHTAGINGAPVTKTVTYKEVSSTMSGAAHCWIAQNLGSDQQATAVNDGTESSAGWYYQFDRSQGYKHDGTNYTPWNTWTSWTNCIVESSDWLPANDPCATELGTGWRLPTNTEWSNIDGSPRNWASATDAYSSELKLHEAGYLSNVNGSLTSRGSVGAYWSGTQDVVQTYNPYYYGTYYSYYMSGYVLSMTGSSSAINYMDKASALPVRCLTDESQIVLLKASISDASIPTSAITGNSATATATVSLDGGSTVTDRGICWNTTGVAPQTSDNVIPGGKGTGTFTGTLSGLTEGPTYYVRAYATNNRGTVYSTNVTSFKICPTFTIQHKAGVDGSPVDKTVTYSTISTTYSGKAACWITQNLGSDQQATAVNDATEASAGWYWQFNRSQGYKHDGTTLTPAIPAWSAWVGGISENSDWLAANDPCALELGTGWRLPTNAEWTAADAIPQNWLTAADAYGSVLKLHEAGYLDSGSGALTSRGATGNYWSSSQYSNTSYGYLMSIASGSSSPTYASKAYAYPVRCLRDQIVASMAGVSDAVIPSATMTSTSAVANVTVTPDGGSTVSARGICWNTTGTPGTSDHVITDSSTGIGSFSLTMSGLVEGPTYYVRAYATNGVGTSYSKNVTSFKICPTFTVNHTVISGAPVDKTETYSSVSTNITGSAKCWITKNLGADLQSASPAENIDDSAGWYWQFDSPQGYQNSVGVRTPVIWNTSVNENSDWLAANDPCMLQLGGGWRLPTNAEWTAADAAPQYWQSASDAFASVLKLHEAGYLTAGGALSGRGSAGYYWSSTQSTSTVGNCLSLASGSSGMTTMSKTAALPVRCIRDDTSNPSVPIMNQVTVLDGTKTGSTINGKAYIMFDGGSSITGRGFCWNTSGNPSITDSKVADGANGTGTFTDTMSGLTTNTTYYVRAYATNTAGVGYGVQTVFRLCPDMTVIHTAGINGAPVTKTVTYKEVSSTMSGAAHCWIAQNLGSDQQATAVNDGTESSAGWYYQFDRSQGYKHDGTNYTPWNTWTSWTNCIVESSDWLPANDPCATELGTGWRLPTNTEWSNIDGSPRNWASATDAYSSELKLHEAGYLSNVNGSLTSRGSVGAYWSGTQDVVQTYNPYYYGTYYSYYMSGYVLSMTGSSSAINYMDKASALPVRCLTDESQIVLLKASISDASIPTSAITGNSATATATVSLDGGSTVTDRGICWNTTGVAPQTSDNVIPGGKGTGTFTGTLSGLTEGPTYYVRAYATNNRGTVYSTNVTSFKICPTFTIQHKAGVDGSPVDKTVTYSTISTTYSGKAACWITQNLGSDQQATAVNDATEASAGWYWQFNRSQGYKHDGTTLTPAIPAWSAWVGGISENSDWLAANDPCALELGTGWRLPTNAEWTAADAIPQNWLTAADAYGSVLKLHEAGYLDSGSGALTSRGATGNYWSSSQYSNTSYGYLMSIASGSSSPTYASKAYAYPVRCLRDQIVASMAGVSDAVIPSATMTSTSAVANVTVTPDGGSTVSARGICWNTTGTPGTSDHVITDSSTGIGSFSLTMSGLVEGPTYYVRAYATNGVGTSYSKNVTSFKICPTFTVNHTVISGAPVDKTETYSSVSTNITGSAKCWITKNLGADLQSASPAENIDDSAGWYWQFDSPQGYQNSVGVRTPVIWNTSVNENNDWLAANDPCMLQLGGGWRLPTNAEWTAADAAPQYWQSASDAFASVLKLHEAGYLTAGGALSGRGSAGYYWSSTQSTSTVGNCLSLASGSSGMTTMSKTAALPVRCIRDDTSNPSVPIMNQVTVLDGTKTGSTINGKAYIMFDGGSSITGRGFCWNTSGNPSITDSKVADGANGTGTFTDTMSGLTTNTTYYVRAYATNTAGVGYGVQTVFRLCPDMTVIHTAGINGAPVTKTVTYKEVSSTMSGAAHCWIAQNLGSDQQATAVNDGTESSAGWYYQFDRSQGYKHDGTNYTPWNTWTSWTNCIVESSDWLPANDPCATELGTGWRITDEYRME